MTEEEAIILRQHVRALHPNLLGLGPDTNFSFSPLASDGLSEVPDKWLRAIHEANHAGLWRGHDADMWRDEEEDPMVVAEFEAEDRERVRGVVVRQAHWRSKPAPLMTPGQKRITGALTEAEQKERVETGGPGEAPTSRDLTETPGGPDMPQATAQQLSRVQVMMARWNTGAPSSRFPGETALSCPMCASTSVELSCNSFYGGAYPWQSVTCKACRHSERVDRIDTEVRAYETTAGK